MSVDIAIGGLCEQDLDLFLLEEIVSNPGFRRWFLSRLPCWDLQFDELVAAKRSVEQTNGESDLELTLRAASGALAMVLIENKISAAFQPSQISRYRERASLYRDRGDCSETVVVLIAPAGYAPSAPQEPDAVVTYEEIEAHLATMKADERTAYKRLLLRGAITKYRHGYNPETDDAVTRFWRAYWEASKRLAPDLEMDAPGGKPSGAGFVWMAPSRLPENLNLCHKLAKGIVDLQLPGLGDHTAQVEHALAPLLEPDMRVARASRSAAVRIEVPPLDTGRPFEEQRSAAEHGIVTATRLLSWAQRHRGSLASLNETVA